MVEKKTLMKAGIVTVAAVAIGIGVAVGVTQSNKRSASSSAKGMDGMYVIDECEEPVPSAKSGKSTSMSYTSKSAKSAGDERRLVVPGTEAYDPYLGLGAADGVGQGKRRQLRNDIVRKLGMMTDDMGTDDELSLSSNGSKSSDMSVSGKSGKSGDMTYSSKGSKSHCPTPEDICPTGKSGKGSSGGGKSGKGTSMSYTSGSKSSKSGSSPAPSLCSPQPTPDPTDAPTTTNPTANPTPAPTTAEPTTAEPTTDKPTLGDRCTTVCAADADDPDGLPLDCVDYPVCPGEPEENYCDGSGRCDTDVCACSLALDFCETGVNPCEPVDITTSSPTGSPTNVGTETVAAEKVGGPSNNNGSRPMEELFP